VTEQLLAFARALRGAGLPVSTADVLTAAAAVRAAGIEERDTFRLALRACLLKANEHSTPFDRLFDVFFHVPWPGDGEAKRKGQRPHQGRPAGRGRPKPEPPAAPTPATQPTQPRKSEEEEEHRRRGRLAAAMTPPPEHERQQAVAKVRLETERRNADSLARRPLWSKPTPLELRGLEREAERLGRLLLTRFGRRYRRAARGRLDMRATVAAATRTGGVPFRLVRRVKKLQRPQLLVLCDVSGSVARTARLLLRLLHATQRLFDRTDGFVFVDRPIAAAPLFRHADFDAALEALESLPGLDLHQSSDFGHVFVKLLSDHARLLTRRTTLLVLGDARCNRFDPQTWALQEIAARVSRVVWLNPERRGRWYSADSRLRDYETCIDHLLPAETLEELAAGITELMRTRR
jgi:uncharacterized protein with von Willebrand factor type A (vWA) domain